MQRFLLPLILLAAWATFLVNGKSGASQAVDSPLAPAPQLGAPGFADASPPKSEVTKTTPTYLEAAPPPGSDELRALLADFIGADSNLGFDRLLEEVKMLWPGYQFRPLIAIVADPFDSQLKYRFDQSLLGLQEAYAEEGFLFDRYETLWRPPSPEKAKKEEPRATRERPGMILLFRHSRRAEMALVFLVGETTKQGVRARALESALALSEKLAPGAPIDVLGPTFSGSIDSMRAALISWHLDHFGGEVHPCSSTPHPPVRIVSGSATAPGLESSFKDLPGTTFSRVVSADDVLLDRSLGFLEERLGWNLDKIVLLTEGDTAYGRDVSAENFSPPRPGADEKSSANAASQDEIRLTPTNACRELNCADSSRIRTAYFPSGIGELRKAWETKRQEERRANAATSTIKKQATTFDLSLSEQPVDLVPEFGDLATPAKDLALGNLLQSLCLEGIRYFGVRATDLRDQLFLIQRVREVCPDATLFTLDSDQLLSHPQLGGDLNGTLVFSSMPLATTPVPEETRIAQEHTGKRAAPRHFIGELHEGTFRAAKILLTSIGLKEIDPPSWVSAVSNGSIWPLARIPPPQSWRTARKLSDRTLIRIMFAGLFVVAFAFAFRTAAAALPPESPRVALGIAYSVLAITATILICIAALPFLMFGASDQGVRALGWLLLGSIALLLGLFVKFSAPKSAVSHKILITATAVFLLSAGAWCLYRLWMPGGAELFHLRARSFSGGLSPIVSVAWLGGALLAWSWSEVRRRSLAPDWSRWAIPPGGEPELSAADTVAEQLKRDTSDRFFERRTWSWILLGSLGCVAFFFRNGQLTAEPRPALLLFLLTGQSVLVLVIYSFLRFRFLWRHLRRLLGLLRTIDFEGVLSANENSLRKAIDWKPMKSFLLKVPDFRMTRLAIDKLVAFKPESSIVLRNLLGAALSAHYKGNRPLERENRKNIVTILDEEAWSFTANFNDLTPPQREFLVVRLVVFLRVVFAHMRDSLSSALLPGLLLLAAVETNNFQPKRLIVLGLLLALCAMILATLWSIAQIERDPVLSTIGDTNPGEVSTYNELVTVVLRYCITPLLVLVTTQLPQTRDFVLQLLNPLLKAMALPNLPLG